MRLRVVSNTRKYLGGLMFLVKISVSSIQNHLTSISCGSISFTQVVKIAILFFLTVCSVITFPFVVSSGFDYGSKLISSITFVIRGNEIEYFRGNTCTNADSDINDYRTPNFEEESNLWTRVSDSVYIYSAYLDQRNYSKNILLSQSNLFLIRIVGLMRMPPAREIVRTNPMKWLKIKEETFLGNKYYCKVFHEDKSNGNMISTLGHSLTYTIIEEGVKIFSAAFFNCYINLDIIAKSKLNKIYIALYPVSVDNYPDKLVSVNNISRRIAFSNHSISFSNRENFSLSICIRPLFGPMDDLPKLVQFLSYYYSMGVTRFTFYDLSISPSVRNYLKTLSKSKIHITLKTWNLPTGNVSELWDFGTLAALNDCLYQNMMETRVIFVDIDEFIVPQNSRKINLVKLVQYYDKFYQLLIRNTFFCHEFCQLSNDSLEESKSPMQWSIFNCPTRTKKIWNANIRGKYIVNPKEIVSVGHHLVTKYVNNFDHRFTSKSFIMKTDVALLYHYRYCRPISTKKHPVLNRLTVTDNTLLWLRNTLEYSLPFTVFKETDNHGRFWD